MTLRNLDKAPFPYFGGKSKAAPLVWQLLGDVDHYIEPFAGSLATLINRPHPCNRAYYSETVNDLDGLIVNAWRAMQHSPEETARHASWPVTEADKTARQAAVIRWANDRMIDLLAGDPDWHDPKMAGWWIWGICVQIGAIDGPWQADRTTGRLVKQPRDNTREPGVTRGLPHLSHDGKGVNHAGSREPGVSRDLPHLSHDGQGVNSPGSREPGVTSLDALAADSYHNMAMPELLRWFRHLSARLRHVRILNGDWERTCTSGAAKTLSVRKGGHAGIFLDPPYDSTTRHKGLYRDDMDNGSVATECLDWCLTNGDDPQYRIVLAGYDTEHGALVDAGWTEHEWYKAGHLTGGMGNLAKGADSHQQHRERLWSSPHCLTADDNNEQLAMWTT